METTKFINKEMACMAATAAFMAASHTGHFANLSGSEETRQFILDVHLELDELFTLPFGYVYSGAEEKRFTSPLMDCPPFKTKRYYFIF